MTDEAMTDVGTGNLMVGLAFRDAMRRLAGTVTVITVGQGANRHGSTATSVTSLSMDPPSLLVCLNRDSRLRGLLTDGGSFCVNILHTDNVEVSKVFAKPLSSEQRFAIGKWANIGGEAPALDGAQANILCRKEQMIDYGSHTIFIGRVMNVVTRADVSPLIYSDGDYAAATMLPGRGK